MFYETVYYRIEETKSYLDKMQELFNNYREEVGIEDIGYMREVLLGNLKYLEENYFKNERYRKGSMKNLRLKTLKEDEKSYQTYSRLYSYNINMVTYYMDLLMRNIDGTIFNGHDGLVHRDNLVEEYVSEIKNKILNIN